MQKILKHLQESLKWPPSAGWEPVEDDTVASGSAVVFSEDGVEDANKDLDKRVERKDQRQPLFVVVNNGNKCKRLHKGRGGCWMGRENHFPALRSTPISARFAGLSQALFQQTTRLHLLQLQVLGVPRVRPAGRANSCSVGDLTQKGR